MAEYQTVQIRLQIGNSTNSANAVVGSPVGAAIIFAQTNNINSLDQLKTIYYSDAPTRPVNPRQVIRLADQGKTFVVEEEAVGAQFPLQCTSSAIVDGENLIPYAFTVHTKKDFGGGYPVAVKVASPGGEVASTLAEEGADYKVNFTPQQDGPHKVTLTFQVTATVDINVGSMLPDPIQCVAYGPGLEKGEQYKDAPFTIEARNKLGARIPFGGHKFVATCRNPFGEDVPVEVVDNGDGTYGAVYVPVVPGNHTVEVTLSEQHIKASPFTVPIDWSSEWAVPHLSYAEGPGLADGNRTRQNKPSQFTIFAVDRNGKRKTTGGDLFDVHIEDPLFDQLKVEVVDKGDGTYDVFYQAKEPGINEVAMFLRNRATPLAYDHIKDSPKGVNILLGTDPKSCTASGPGLQDGIEDTEPAEFTIQARDRNGNPIKYGDEPFVVKVRDPNGQPVPVDVKDNGDGTYGVVYRPDVDGPHTIEASLDDIPLKDMPKIVQVVPGAWAGTTRIETVHFKIQTCDKRGKKLTVGGQPPKTAVAANNKPVTLKEVDNNNGTYDYQYAPKEAIGTVYTISSTIKGNNLLGSPFQQTI